MLGAVFVPAKRGRTQTPLPGRQDSVCGSLPVPPMARAFHVFDQLGVSFARCAVVVKFQPR